MDTKPAERIAVHFWPVILQKVAATFSVGPPPSTSSGAREVVTNVAMRGTSPLALESKDSFDYSLIGAKNDLG